MSKAKSTTTALTWESQLSLDERQSIDLAARCTWEVEALCLSMLENVRGELSNAESPLVATMRMNAARILRLNRVLMSQLDEDGTTLGQAYEALYGVEPAEGSTP